MIAAAPLVLEDNTSLKRAVVFYYLLLLFEGGLRRWFLPGLATPLLVVRDPLCFFLLFQCWQRGILSWNMYTGIMIPAAIFSVYTAVFLGHGSLVVALYGARIILLHVPLLFVIGSLLNREDVLRIGRLTLWIALPMTVLIVIQLFSPQSAWVNRGLGGDLEGAGFGGALGYYRPPGTFSFTNGVTLFYSFLSCYIFYFWTNPRVVNKLLLVAASVCLLVAIPVSISRGLFFQICVGMLFFLFPVIRKPQFLGKLVFFAVFLVVGFLLLARTEFFQIAIEAFTARFETASDYEEKGLKGVLVDRFLGGLVGALLDSSNYPIWGLGIGMGTNVGSKLLSGTRTFLIAEEEWGRVVGELGPIIGLCIILLRVHMGVSVAARGFSALRRGDMLPWMLLSFGLLNMMQGGWAQPTSLGFYVMIGGLLLASLKRPEDSPVV